MKIESLTESFKNTEGEKIWDTLFKRILKPLKGHKNKLKNTKPLEKKVCKMIQKSEKI